MRRTYWMSVEQLATIIAALMLASCVRVQAQFGVEQPMFAMQSRAATPFTPASITNIWAWWKDSTLTSGTVTNWVDSLNGIPMTNQISGKTPTMTAFGLYFNGNDWLKLNGVSLSSDRTNSVFAVIQPTNSLNTWDTFIGDSSAERGFMLQSMIWHVKGVSSDQAIGSAWKTNVVVDVVYGGGPNPVQWTNGVAMGSLLPNSFFIMNMIGANQSSGADCWEGYIREIAIWTNSIGLTTNDVVDLHNYATNTYGYTP